jgi:zinc/manganese transport system ATP-binding protein
VITLKDISFGYHKTPLLSALDMRFEKGDFCAVIGGNGAGKSTFLKGLAGLLAPQSGRLHCEGTLHYVPQQAQLNLDFPLSLHDFILLGAQSPQRLNAALKLMNLSDYAQQQLNTLSGGQVQRAIFARMMLSQATILLLDEPFSMMDAQTTLTCLTFLKSKAKEGCTVICVLHDYELVRHYFPKTLILARKILAFGATQAVLTPDVMHKAHKL